MSEIGSFALGAIAAGGLLLLIYFSVQAFRSNYTGIPDPDDGGRAFVEPPMQETAALSEPEDQALDGLGNPAAPEVDKGGD